MESINKNQDPRSKNQKNRIKEEKIKNNKHLQLLGNICDFKFYLLYFDLGSWNLISHATGINTTSLQDRIQKDNCCTLQVLRN
jgi:hypothetical protein